MTSKQLFASTGLATILAITAPAHAGGLGGNLSGIGGRGLSGTGSFASQGQLSGTTGSLNTKPVSNAVKKVDPKATVDTAKSTVSDAKDSATNVAGNTAGKVDGTANSAAAGASTTAATSAAATSAAASKPAASTPVASTPAASAPVASAPAAPATAASATQPTASSGLAGSVNQSASAGAHNVAANGALDAQHGSGSSSLTTSVTGSAN